MCIRDSFQKNMGFISPFQPFGVLQDEVGVRADREVNLVDAAEPTTAWWAIAEIAGSKASMDW